jgi:hypothetical protein
MSSKIELNEYSIRYLFRYYITLKDIVEKLRSKSIGRKGQITDEEYNFIHPIIMKSFLQHMTNKD